MASILSGLATYAALTETPPFGNNQPDTVIRLLNLDLVLMLMFVALVAQRIVSLWSGRKRGLAGSHLHVRLIYIFSVLAATPVIIMTVFSAFFFHFGVQTWFSQRVQTAVNESQAVAEAYLEEHTQVIRADTLAMANDLNRQFNIFISNERALEKILQTQSIFRNLSEAIVFDSSGRILARSGLTFSLEFEEIPAHMMASADEGEVVVMTGANDDRVRALVKLDNFADSYLFVGRMIDPKVLSHLDATKRATQDYLALQNKYSSLQISVTMIFVVVGLLLLFTAIWFGLVLARQLVTPISALITTADRVRAGDLSARVPEEESLQEFEYLAVSFNRMTRQIQEQQSELIEANRQLDRRRHFTETVLAGVTSGVVGLDEDGMITVANSSAHELLGLEKGRLIGRPMPEIIPEITELLQKSHEQTEKITQGEIPFLHKGESRRTFLVRVAIEKMDEEEIGTILTFDDITDLQSAQRKAAWADVARRIAHEIKNPLTPIQLSAERLKKRYLEQIKDDPQTFIECTDTIIRHVGDIGHMVSEFSAFARMPEPKMKHASIDKQLKNVIILQKQAHSEIKFEEINKTKKEYFAHIDAQQIRQALTNLLQNAIDSIHIKIENGALKKGHIRIIMGEQDEETMFLSISDNGLGFPEGEDKTSLTEPYVTHKTKGTGLGLAIVKKIMEDHNGKIILGAPEWLRERKEWTDLGGATTLLILPLEPAEEKQ
ncbi:MAG: PAS domain-containing sensor histidine kinase [Alphaproteobacteria bacterium]|nr:PAS domain-containing sensor histidine kinase [Alphaproteobacteria bacterium]